MQQAIWGIKTKGEQETVKSLAREFELKPLVMELLVQRGMTDPAEIAEFLQPRLQDLTDPYLMPNMEAAVNRVFQAIDKKEKVVVYGDYDVDGVTSLTLLQAILRAYGLEAHTFLPHRMDEGYGLNDQGIERCLTEFKPSLLIAVDCGTSSIDQVRGLQESGIDVLVLDHHESNTGELPPAVAVVNPKLGDDYHYLCSAGVVFKLGHGMLKRRPVAGFDMRRYMDIVALGTVADLVPLVDENRIFVRKGLQQMEVTQHPGLNALKIVAGVNGRPLAYDIGFKLGPRLNAAGRLDTAQASLDLLTSDDFSHARELAQFLDDQNRSRQELENRIKEEALEMMKGFNHRKDFAVVLGSDTWHPGVVGIVAARISKQVHRPTFIIAIDEEGMGKGSGRSVPGISLVQALNACREHLEAGGGHDMAAGLSIRQENIDIFREQFNAYIAQTAEPDLLRPRVDIDLVAGFDEMNLELLDSYEMVHPMGMGNPAPLFMSRGVEVVEEPRVLKGKHLKLNMQQNGRRLDAIYFNGVSEDLPKPPWDVAYRIERNIYRGNHSLGMTIEAIRKAK